MSSEDGALTPVPSEQPQLEPQQQQQEPAAVQDSNGRTAGAGETGELPRSPEKKSQTAAAGNNFHFSEASDVSSEDFSGKNNLILNLEWNFKFLIFLVPTAVSLLDSTGPEDGECESDPGEKLNLDQRKSQQHQRKKIVPPSPTPSLSLIHI